MAEEKLHVHWKCFSRVTVWQCDHRKNGSCLTLTPCREINSQRSALTSWRQVGMEKMLWGGHTPADCMGWINPSERKRRSGARWWQTGTDQNLDSSSSSSSNTAGERSSLQSVVLPSAAKKRKRWNEAGGVKEERQGGELFRGTGLRGEGSVRGEGKAEFWQLESRERKNKIGPSSLWNLPTQWKWKSVNSKDKCYHSSLYIAHMVPWADLPPKP